jgi:hypothetical protein
VSSYVYNKAWRLKHPKERYSQKKRYYRKHRETPKNLANGGQEWTLAQIKLITAPERSPDAIIAKEIGKSVQAIHIKRSRITS